MVTIKAYLMEVSMSEADDKGKLEVSVRILGNELVALRMDVDDFKMKWLVMGVVAIVALGWAAGNFGPELISMFGE
jgi:hypothetical protein